MTFTRTASGISSYKSFLKVDYIIFSEGGENCSDENSSNWGIDVVFWRSAFSRFRPDLKCKIKPLGSKKNVIPYAEKIFNNEITNSIAVMDRDHDNHHKKLLDHPKIIYTLGYSWENDAWCIETLISLLCKLSGNDELPPETNNEIKSKYDTFSNNFKRLVFVDVLCSLSQIKGN